MMWTDAERAVVRDAAEWRMVVLQTNLTHRQRHPWRIKFAQWLRKLVVLVEP